MEYTKSEDYVNKNITLPLLASNFCVKNFVNHTSQEEYDHVRNSILSQKTKTGYWAEIQSRRLRRLLFRLLTATSKMGGYFRPTPPLRSPT